TRAPSTNSAAPDRRLKSPDRGHWRIWTRCGSRGTGSHAVAPVVLSSWKARCSPSSRIQTRCSTRVSPPLSRRITICPGVAGVGSGARLPPAPPPGGRRVAMAPDPCWPPPLSFPPPDEAGRQAGEAVDPGATGSGENPPGIEHLDVFRRAEHGPALGTYLEVLLGEGVRQHGGQQQDGLDAPSPQPSPGRLQAQEE